MSVDSTDPPPEEAVATNGDPNTIQTDGPASATTTTTCTGRRQVLRPSRRVLIPPPNFGMVEDNLYRSGQPSELNFPFLEKLKLRTVVWLAPEDPGSRL